MVWACRWSENAFKNTSESISGAQECVKLFYLLQSRDEGHKIGKSSDENRSLNLKGKATRKAESVHKAQRDKNVMRKEEREMWKVFVDPILIKVRFQRKIKAESYLSMSHNTNE